MVYVYNNPLSWQKSQDPVNSCETRCCNSSNLALGFLWFLEKCRFSVSKDWRNWILYHPQQQNRITCHKIEDKWTKSKDLFFHMLLCGLLSEGRPQFSHGCSFSNNLLKKNLLQRCSSTCILEGAIQASKGGKQTTVEELYNMFWQHGSSPTKRIFQFSSSIFICGDTKRPSMLYQTVPTS